jgi:glycosyltransferase involved in cell wall biosynthesis
MRILFQNRDKESWLGGDMIQLEMTQKYLEKLGIETRFSSKMIADPQDIIDVDWVHCFNFSMPWTKYQIWNAKKLGKKVVCSMIYHETGDFVDYPTQQAMINELDAIIFLTTGEMARAKRHLEFDNRKVYVIPNGIERWWFDSLEKENYSHAQLMNTVISSTDVLTVGRLDANKGQLTTAQACKKLGLNYTCIGEGSRYGDLVKAEGATILAPLPQKELKAYYARCKVYAQVSYKEIMPLTVMEAGSQGKPIVMTNGCEWQIPCERAIYNSVGSICDALEKSLHNTSNNDFRDQLKKMTWEKVASKLKKIYETNN